MDIKTLFDLTGQVVIVTGGTGFYGKPISEGLAEAGAHVVIRFASSCEDWVAPRLHELRGNRDESVRTQQPDYQFHKHGMVGLTKYLAAWAGPSGVRVNAISPGGLGLGDEKEPFLSQYCRRVYLGRMANYDDIKGAVVLLASEASAYITGQNLVVDGGYSC